MKFKVVLYFLLLSGFMQTLSSQIIIRGTVKDSITGEPLIGATVVQIDRNNRFINGTIADVNGSYTIQVTEEDALLGYSYIGYQSKEIQAGIRTAIDVLLHSQSAELEEVVIVAERTSPGDGLSNIPIRNLATSVSAVDMSALSEVPTGSVAEALQGRVSGVDINMGSGDPGAGMSIKIRGNASVFRTANPLIVLDGVPYETSIGSDFDFLSADVADYGSLVDISPADIRSIQILKDAASAAVWGSRGANGVIVISTKRGTTRKAKFDLDYRTSFVQQPKPLPMLNGDQYVRLMLDQRFNRNPVGVTNIPIEYLNDPGYVDYYNYNHNTDWVKAVNQNGYTNDVNFSVSGGGDKARYRASLGYYDQLGTTIGTGLTRITTRLNLDYNISDKLKLSTDFSYSNSDRDQNYFDGDWGNRSRQVRPMAYRKAPHMSVYEYDVNGNLTGNYFSPERSEQGLSISNPNPVALAYDGVNNDVKDRVLTNFLLSYQLLPSLSYQANVSFDVTNSRTTRLLPQSATGVILGNDQLNRAQSREDNQNIIQTYNKLIFTPNLGPKHNLMVLGLFSTYDRYASQMSVSVSGIPSFYIAEASNPGTNEEAGSFRSRTRTLSYLLNSHYVFNDKYIIGGSVRIDGDSRFGKSSRYGVFPSLSVAWRISSEDFLSGYTWLSDLKPRISYGVNGSSVQRSYEYLARYSSTGGYMDLSGIELSNVQLNNLRWETTTQINYGVDISLFDYKYTVNFDYYDKFTKDIIFTDLRIPSTSGFSDMTMNWGEMSNKGWELNLNTVLLRNENTRISMDFNISRNFNIIEKIPENYASEVFSVDNGRYARRILEGYPLGAFYGFRYLGVFSRPEDVIAYGEDGNPIMNPITGDPLPYSISGQNVSAGDAIYQDINFDGNINELDIVYLGNSNPDYIGGFGINIKYKRLSVSSFFNYKLNQDVVNETRMLTENMYTNDNQSTAVLRRWRKNGDDTDIPRAILGQGRNWLGSDRFVEDASFLRMKSFSLSYILPENYSRYIGSSSIKAFLTAYNMLTLTNYSGQDPEVGFSSRDPFALGIDRSMTPPPVSITAGINMTF